MGIARSSSQFTTGTIKRWGKDESLKERDIEINKTKGAVV
jgi:hypothetical protein